MLTVDGVSRGNFFRCGAAVGHKQAGLMRPIPSASARRYFRMGLDQGPDRAVHLRGRHCHQHRGQKAGRLSMLPIRLTFIQAARVWAGDACVRRRCDGRRGLLCQAREKASVFLLSMYSRASMICRSRKKLPRRFLADCIGNGGFHPRRCSTIFRLPRLALKPRRLRLGMLRLHGGFGGS